MNRGVITAVLKWRGRSPVERAAAAPFSLGSTLFVATAIRNGARNSRIRPQKKSKNCRQETLQYCNDLDSSEQMTAFTDVRAGSVSR